MVIAPLADARLIALDAKSGQRCNFGDVTELNLREGLGEHTISHYMANTPPAILGSLLITGASIADNMNTEVPSGVVRAYDLVTGDLEWAWEPLLEVPDSGNHSGHREGIPRGTYIKGTSNVWSFISVDTALGLVYVPTGNTSPDYYGGHREGSDFY